MTNEHLRTTVLYFMVIIAFTSGCPSSCICTTPGAQFHVICVDAKLISVPDDIPSSTTHLYLATNSISLIEKDDFVGLGNLKTLDLFDNKIESIHDEAFQPLTQLTKLYLEQNKLQSLGPQHLQSLRRLETLDVSSNPNLIHLEECILSPLDKLEILLLSGSPIDYGLYLFGNITLCSSYPCNVLSDSRCRLPLLSELDISQTATDEVPVELFLLTPNLEVLSLAGNEITSIPDDSFVGLTTLRQLSINYNNLTNVSQRTFNGLSDLVKLDIGNLGLVIEPDIFDVLPNLAELSLTLLGQIVIDSLAPSVANTAVTKLNLHHNFLLSIPASMAQLSTITSLDLSQNTITHVSAREFSPSLKDIDLTYNNLDSLHQDAFHGLNQLETLKLCYNVLTIVPSTIFDQIPQTAVICLGQNPWVCNCTMLPIIIDPRSHNMFPTPLCSSPTDLSGRPFSVVNEDDLNCTHTTTTTPTTTPTTTVTMVADTTTASIRTATRTNTPFGTATSVQTITSGKIISTLIISEASTNRRHTSPFVSSYDPSSSTTPKPLTAKSTEKYSRTTTRQHEKTSRTSSTSKPVNHTSNSTTMTISIVISALAIIITVLTVIACFTCKLYSKTQRRVANPVHYSTPMPYNASNPTPEEPPPDYESIFSGQVS